MLTINGAHGEGGGQIIRTALTMATILNQPIRLENIRARRKNPGLAAQHLTAVHAAATLCQAQVSGAELESQTLTFEPQTAPQPGQYQFDVAEARPGGSAGATSLIAHTLLLPLALAPQPSRVNIKGGTHVAWSPTFHHLHEVFLPMLAQLGLIATAELRAWGWYPAGEGEIQLDTPGQSKLHAPADWQHRGPLKQIRVLAVASSLPAHIAQRMANRARNLLTEAALNPTVGLTIEPRRVRSVSPGAGLFLMAEYERSRVGFTALGRLGKPSEVVAAEAVEQLLAFHQTEAVVDEYLADQLLLPLVLTGEAVTLSTTQISQHTRTNLWLIEQFFGPVAELDLTTGLIHVQANPERQARFLNHQ